MSFKNVDLKIVDDFQKFCSFIETEKPVLSQKKGVLGKKEAFKLNSMMNYKRKVDAPNYQQEQYFCLDLLFSLALEGLLFVKVRDNKGRLLLQRTERLNNFLQLNDCEQYVFLLETYWCYFKFENKFSWIRRNQELYSLCNLFQIFRDAGAGKKIVKQDSFINKTIGSFFSYEFPVILQLSFFALCDYELNDEARNPHDDRLKAIIPTPLGITVTGQLLDKGLPFREKNYLPPAYRILAAKKRMTKREKGLHKILARAFPEGAVKKTVNFEPVKEYKGTYYFKAALRKTLWRTIKLAHVHTLADLHLAIQGAFDLDNDHLYVFFLDNEKRERQMQYGVFCNEAEDGDFQAEETLIGECGFYPGQPLTYLYDFGYSIIFDLTLLKIDPQEPLPASPVLVEGKGESPDCTWSED